VICVDNLSPAMGAGNQVRLGLSYRPASLCSSAAQFQTLFLESIPRPIAGLKFSALEFHTRLKRQLGKNKQEFILRSRRVFWKV
jgi:hypothetical protein